MINKLVQSLFLIAFLLPLSSITAQEDRILMLNDQLLINWASCDGIILTYLLPNDIEGIQKITEMRFSLDPDTIYEKDGNKYAEFGMQGKNKPDKLDIRILLETKQNDFNTRKKNWSC